MSTTFDLDYYLPADIDKLEDRIQKTFKFNLDDFYFETRNPEQRFIPELWITHSPTQYYVRTEYITAPKEIWLFRYTPGPHGDKQESEYAPAKGPDFYHIDNFFIKWLGIIKPHVEAIERMKKKRASNKTLNPDKIEFIDTYPDTELEENYVQGLKDYTQWLLPQAQQQVGKIITQEQYDELESRVQDLESKLAQPKPKRNMIGHLFFELVKHEAYTAISPYIHHYGLTPGWEFIKSFLPGGGLLPPGQTF